MSPQPARPSCWQRLCRLQGGATLLGEHTFGKGGPSEPTHTLVACLPTYSCFRAFCTASLHLLVMCSTCPMTAASGARICPLIWVVAEATHACRAHTARDAAAGR